MLRIIKGSIFDSPAQTIVNTVNTVGVMGKGIAKEFKARYPKMFSEYKKLCDDRVLEVGILHLWHGSSRWVLNFPTKTTWKLPSRLDYVEAGLRTFVQCYERMGIRSISFPPLGCGNGNLEWEEVRPMMLHYLWDLNIPIYIHDRHVSNTFRPEHSDVDAKLPPISFDEFMKDLNSVIRGEHGRFKTLWEKRPYNVDINNDYLDVFTDKKESFELEFLVDAWVGLQLGLLTKQTFGDEAAQRAACYLLPILAKLPYVSYTKVQFDPRKPKIEEIGLFFNATPDGYDDYLVSRLAPEQRCLFQ